MVDHIRLIKLQVTEDDIRNWVDEIIAPENADAEAKRLMDILFAVSNVDKNHEGYYLADVAARHAYTKTQHCLESFNDFAGLPKFRAAAEQPAHEEFQNEH